MALQRDHWRGGAFAQAFWQTRKREARALDEPLIDHRDLQLRELKAIREDTYQTSQSFGRDENERPETSRLGFGATCERCHAIERDQRLADARFAVDDKGRIRWKIDRSLLIAVEHDELGTIGLGDRSGSWTCAWMRPVGRNDGVVAN
ncbi:MAG: hypothetical protein QM831_09225 [Kofleriaceae bacterium]